VQVNGIKVPQFNHGSCFEWHGETTMETARTIALPHRGIQAAVFAEPDAKEVAQRHLDRGALLLIPAAPDYHPAHRLVAMVIPSIHVGHGDMPDDTGTGKIGQYQPAVGRQRFVEFSHRRTRPFHRYIQMLHTADTRPPWRFYA